MNQELPQAILCRVLGSERRVNGAERRWRLARVTGAGLVALAMIAYQVSSVGATERLLQPVGPSLVFC